eukprot:31386-Pelagococcus_subviridis.AAC.2
MLYTLPSPPPAPRTPPSAFTMAPSASRLAPLPLKLMFCILHSSKSPSLGAPHFFMWHCFC